MLSNSNRLLDIKKVSIRKIKKLLKLHLNRKNNKKIIKIMERKIKYLINQRKKQINKGIN